MNLIKNNELSRTLSFGVVGRQESWAQSLACSGADDLLSGPHVDTCRVRAGVAETLPAPLPLKEAGQELLFLGLCPCCAQFKFIL